MTEMNSSGLETTVFLAGSGPDGRQEDVFIDRRQLLSVINIKENMEGEKEPNFKIVQQPETNYLPLPSCMLDLQVGIPIAEVKNLQEEQLIKSTTPVTEQDYVIDAMPVAFKPRNASFVINIMRHGKRWASPRPYTSAEERKISVDEKVARLQSNAWLKNWDIEPRQRKNGKWDYYYRHKTLKFMCRSLVEVHFYDMNGYLPKRSKKPKNDGSSAGHYENVKAQKPVFSAPSKKRMFEQGSISTSTPELRNNTATPTNDIILIEERIARQIVEDFLAESYSNLMNMSFPNQYSIVKDFDYEEEGIEEFLKDSFEPLLTTTSTTPNLNSSKGVKKARSEDEISEKRETKRLKAIGSPKPPSGHGSTTHSSGNLSYGGGSACATPKLIFSQESASASANLPSDQVSATVSPKLNSSEESATAIANFLSDQEWDALANAEITTDTNKITSSSTLEQYLAEPWADLLAHIDT